MKTAEEIIKDVVGIKPGAGPLTPMDYSECKMCMQQFAAQEVEAYKERVFKNMKKLVPGSTPSDWELGWSSAVAASVQTIKQTK